MTTEDEDEYENPYYCRECEDAPHKDWCRRGQAINMKKHARIKECSYNGHKKNQSTTNVCSSCGGVMKAYQGYHGN